MAKFKDVIDAFERGEKIRQVGWASDCYIQLSHLGQVRDEQDHGFQFGGADIFNEDWEVVEPTTTFTRQEFNTLITRLNDDHHSFYLAEFCQNILLSYLFKEST